MTTEKIQIYHYYRSTTSWRVRIALAHKQIDCEYKPINLLKGEHRTPEYRALSPLETVPTLRSGSFVLSESLAILQWLEDAYPQNPLIPRQRELKALVWQGAELINSGIHPIQNMRVQKAISDEPRLRKEWARRWIDKGLRAYEQFLSLHQGNFSVGNQLSIADLCLVPQVYNARRFELNLGHLPRIRALDERLCALPAFEAAHPSRFEPKK